MRPLGDEDRGARPLRVVRRVELAAGSSRAPGFGSAAPSRSGAGGAGRLARRGLEEVRERHAQESSGPLQGRNHPCRARGRHAAAAAHRAAGIHRRDRPAVDRHVPACVSVDVAVARRERLGGAAHAHGLPGRPGPRPALRGPAERPARAAPADPRRALRLRRRVAALRARARRPHAHGPAVRPGVRGRGRPRHRPGGRARHALRRRGGAAVLVPHAHHRGRPDPRPRARRADPRADVVAGDLRRARGHRGRGLLAVVLCASRRRCRPSAATPAACAGRSARCAACSGTRFHGLRGRVEPLVRHRLRLRVRLVLRPAGHLRAVAAALQRRVRVQRDRAHHLQPDQLPDRGPDRRRCDPARGDAGDRHGVARAPGDHPERRPGSMGGDGAAVRRRVVVRVRAAERDRARARRPPGGRRRRVRAARRHPVRVGRGGRAARRRRGDGHGGADGGRHVGRWGSPGSRCCGSWSPCG